MNIAVIESFFISVLPFDLSKSKLSFLIPFFFIVCMLYGPQPKVNLSLQDSYEFLFKCYWEYIKEKEGITSEHVKYANYLLNDNRNYDSNLSDNYVEEGEGLGDFEDQLTMTYRSNDVKEHKPSHSRKRSKGKPYIAKRKERSKTKMFLGWGSKCLFEFLTSIGQETNKELSQHDVTIIIFGYCRDNNLLDPLEKKYSLWWETMLSSGKEVCQ